MNDRRGGGIPICREEPELSTSFGFSKVGGRYSNKMVLWIFFSPDNNMRLLPIRPRQLFTYRWKIMPKDGPASSDPRCLTRFYYSSIKPARDLASGLIGPLLICSKETMDQKGNQVGSLLHVRGGKRHILTQPHKELNVLFCIYQCPNDISSFKRKGTLERE